MSIEGSGGRVLAALDERIDPAARVKLAPQEVDGVALLRADLPGPFRAVFTTRHGGCSTGPYASLNLNPRSEDAPIAVAGNRARLARALAHLEGQTLRTGPKLLGETDEAPGIRPDAPAYRLVSPRQEHGLRVMGTAEYVRYSSGEPCDGLTIHPLLDRGLAALLLFADCVPVVLVGEVDMAVAHGGWRGVLEGVVQQAARAMTGPPGLAIIGPSIGPCCFTVGEEVARAFVSRYGADMVRRSSDGEPRVDLWAAVGAALAEVGIRADQVTNPRLCTCCNVDLFYSYRREGSATGRHGAVVWAVPPGPGLDGQL